MEIIKMNNDHLTRQVDILPTKYLNEKITIIGAGAIGSFTALSLAKMGFEYLTVIDYDKIDIENMNCQFYRFKDIGSQKVDALQALIKDFTNVEIETINDKYNNTVFDGIVIIAVDNMLTRKDIYNTFIKKGYNTKLVIDSRMSVETALIYTYKPMVKSDHEIYAKSLYSDKEAVQERCTAKSTMYTACILAGLIGRTVKEFIVHKTRYLNYSMDIKTGDIIIGKEVNEEV